MGVDKDMLKNTQTPEKIVGIDVEFSIMPMTPLPRYRESRL